MKASNDSLLKNAESIKLIMMQANESKKSLEIVNSDLIRRLEMKESEVVNSNFNVKAELKNVRQDLEEELEEKGEVIDKAQKVIKKLNDEV